MKEEVERQLALLPRKRDCGKVYLPIKLIIVRNMDEAAELTNSYAPEHHYQNSGLYVRCRSGAS